MTAPADDDEDDKRALERTILFSDAVIAIAITLLVLDIRLPDAPLTDPIALRDALVALWPKYFAYALSFLVVGSFWMGHNQKFRLIRRFDSTLAWINLLFLMAIGFVPFASSVLSSHENATSFIFYDATMVVAALLSAATWAYASAGDRLTDPGLDPALRRRGLTGPLRVGAAFAVSLLLTLVAPHYARWAWLLLIPAAFGQKNHKATHEAVT
jgi:uncharacterized membrane protein